MKNSQFPHLLANKATLFASFTRYDLITVGGCYLVLSWLKVSGLTALFINILVLLSLRLSKKWIQVGFFKSLFKKRQYCWYQSWGKLNG